MITFTRWLLVVGMGASLLLAACGDDSDPDPDPVPSTGITLPEYPLIQAEGPPCVFADWEVFRNIATTCMEMVYDQVPPPEAAPDLVGLAFGADGTLYVARTAVGEIWALRDTTGDQFLDDAQPVAVGLDLPTHLTVHQGALIVVSVGGLVRLEPDGAGGFADPVVLVADLGGDPRRWPDAVHVGPDGRLYVGLGGDLVSFAPDGSDRRVEVTGLSSVTDFAWHPTTGDLWLLDSRGPGADFDALLRVPPGAVTVPDFTPPGCLHEVTGVRLCLDQPADAIAFTDQSAPVGLAFYEHDGWPFWQGDLMIALGGSWNRAEPSGYAVLVAGFDAAGQADGFIDLVLPSSEQAIWYRPLVEFSLGRRGLFPYHPSDIAISPEGWLYVGIQEGRIIRLRPRPAE